MSIRIYKLDNYLKYSCLIQSQVYQLATKNMHAVVQCRRTSKHNFYVLFFEIKLAKLKVKYQYQQGSKTKNLLVRQTKQVSQK